MTPPDAFALFAFYHLGLDPETWQYRFRNLHAVARRWNVTSDDVTRWLAAHRLDADTCVRVDFNLAGAHGAAMGLELDGAPAEARRAFAEATWAQFTAARDRGLLAEAKSHVDWDDPLGKKPATGARD